MSDLIEEPTRERVRHAVQHDDPHAGRVALVMMLVTLLAAGTAVLERHAVTSQSHADRQARKYSLQAVGALVASTLGIDERDALNGAQADLGHVSDGSRRTLEPDDSYANALADAYQSAARTVAQRANDFFPEYEVGDGFDEVAFYQDREIPRFAAEERQKAYSEERTDWASKRGHYILALTIFAVALFLLGLTLTVRGGVRGMFFGGGSILAGAASIFVIVAWQRDVEHPNPVAIQAYSRAAAEDEAARSFSDAGTEAKYNQVIVDASRAIEARHDYQEAYFVRGYNFQSLDFLNPHGPQGSTRAIEDLRHATSLDHRDYFAWANLGNALFWHREYDEALDAAREAVDLSPERPIARQNLGLLLLVENGGRRSEEYRRALGSLRESLVASTTKARASAYGSFDSTASTARKWRANEQPLMRSIDVFESDSFRIRHELDAALASYGDPLRRSTRARVLRATLTVPPTRERAIVNVHFSGGRLGDLRFYYLYVDGVRVDAQGPFAWKKAGTKDDGFTAELHPARPVIPGSAIRAEIFVNAHLLSVCAGVLGLGDKDQRLDCRPPGA